MRSSAAVTWTEMDVAALSSLAIKCSKSSVRAGAEEVVHARQPRHRRRRAAARAPLVDGGPVDECVGIAADHVHRQVGPRGREIHAPEGRRHQQHARHVVHGLRGAPGPAGALKARGSGADTDDGYRADDQSC